MFVVRIAGPAQSDTKVFQRRADAFSRFVAARAAIIEDGLDGVRAALFYVPNEIDARRAVERVIAADPDVIIVEKSWVELSPEEEAQVMEMLREAPH